MAKVSDIVNAANKGSSGLIIPASSIQVYARLPFNIFPFDLALGGGIPEGKFTMMVGPHSSGKTTSALILLREYQKMYPNKVNVWVDAEHAFDSQWAKLLGVNLEGLHIVKPDYAEQAVDVCEGVLQTEDIGLMILDSIAALVPKEELEKSADKTIVGTTPKLVTTFMRKCTSAMITQSKKEIYPTVLLLNQLRMKIGVMFGNPETWPGGMALFHFVNMIIRLYGKDVMDKKVHETYPARRIFSFTLKKKKCPVLAMSAEFEMAMLPHDNLSVGGVKDTNVIMRYAEALGFIKNTKKGWLLHDDLYRVKKDIEAKLDEDFTARSSLKNKIQISAFNNLGLMP